MTTLMRVEPLILSQLCRLTHCDDPTPDATSAIPAFNSKGWKATRCKPTVERHGAAHPRTA